MVRDSFHRKRDEVHEKYLSGRRRDDTGGAWNCNLCGENGQRMISLMLGAPSEANSGLKWTKESAFSIQNIFRCGALCQGMLQISKHNQVLSAKFMEYRSISGCDERTVMQVWSSAEKLDLLNGTNQEDMLGESRLCLHTLFSYFPQIMSSCIELETERWTRWVFSLIQSLCDGYFFCDLLTWKTNCLSWIQCDDLLWVSWHDQPTDNLFHYCWILAWGNFRIRVTEGLHFECTYLNSSLAVGITDIPNWISLKSIVHPCFRTKDC